MDGPADIVFHERNIYNINILNKLFKTWREHMHAVGDLTTWKNRLSTGHMQIIDLMGKDISNSFWNC